MNWDRNLIEKTEVEFSFLENVTFFKKKTVLNAMPVIRYFYQVSENEMGHILIPLDETFAPASNFDKNGDETHPDWFLELFKKAEEKIHKRDRMVDIFNGDKVNLGEHYLNNLESDYKSSITSILQRMRELAIEADNGSGIHGNALKNEFEMLQDEIEIIADTNSFNGITLLKDENEE
jgi:hypothetical protein